VSSEALRREAAVLAKEMGIRPLRTGETRPDGFYLRQHFTGEPVVSDWQAFVVSSPGRETPRKRAKRARQASGAGLVVRKRKAILARLRPASGVVDER